MKALIDPNFKLSRKEKKLADTNTHADIDCDICDKFLLYHSSAVGGIENLEPHISNHKISALYLSSRRENTIVYLSNAIEKYHKNNDIHHTGNHYTWASYGFNSDGILVLDEYYPNATEETYKRVSGYVYSVHKDTACSELHAIPYAFISYAPLEPDGCEYIEDAYIELLDLETAGKIIINKYENNSIEKNIWIKKTIINEYNTHQENDDYILFLEAKFSFL